MLKPLFITNKARAKCPCACCRQPSVTPSKSNLQSGEVIRWNSNNQSSMMLPTTYPNVYNTNYNQQPISSFPPPPYQQSTGQPIDNSILKSEKPKKTNTNNSNINTTPINQPILMNSLNDTNEDSNKKIDYDEWYFSGAIQPVDSNLK